MIYGSDFFSSKIILPLKIPNYYLSEYLPITTHPIEPYCGFGWLEVFFDCQSA